MCIFHIKTNLCGDSNFLLHQKAHAKYLMGILECKQEGAGWNIYLSKLLISVYIYYYRVFYKVYLWVMLETYLYLACLKICSKYSHGVGKGWRLSGLVVEGGGGGGVFYLYCIVCCVLVSTE